MESVMGPSQQLTTLFRPVGLQEYRLIVASGCKEFPPRLPEQPIFYPVTNIEYAISIALNWNAPDEKCGYVGLVMEFELPTEYLKKFKEQVVGNNYCRELWVPAEDLAEFNSKIQGPIRLSKAFYGDKYCGERFQI
jgi:hypothetical protein